MQSPKFIGHGTNPSTQMQSQVSKPLLVYDDDCDFCRYWIAQWQHVTQDRIDYAPYQEVAQQ
ncbi:MAG: hypothetical protein OXU23_17785, partial [Candidatus Poribacteria bacterium]|nr:hypothetical protein [Candidatus Poribacteria bacterium]